jgi:2-oxoglutarate dehydrogenase E2 component (dihydrolipoamide succinyltransferase)
VAGVLTTINFPEGATVVVDTVVAVIGDASSAETASATSAEKLHPEGGGGYNPRILPAESARALAPEIESPASPSVSHAVAAQNDSAMPPRSSPLVRRMAKDNHLDLRQIAGSGSEGRITKEDVLRYLSQHGPGSEAPQAQLAAPQVPQLAPPQVAQVVPLTKMRAIIAQRMVESLRISPHVHTVYKVDMTRIARLREREKARFEQQHGVKLTYMPFIAVAAVQALVKFPIVNASLIDGFLHYHPQINLGIAVALEWGLIVPVVRQAERRSFLELTRAIADLAERARTKKLLPDEVQGGTFTLTNSGVFGGEFGTPILNQPESAILAIGGLRKEPVVLTDTEGNDTIAIRSMQHFCLGFDHRLIDGADAGRFMSEFKKTLESWDKPIG